MELVTTHWTLMGWECNMRILAYVISFDIVEFRPIQSMSWEFIMNKTFAVHELASHIWNIKHLRYYAINQCIKKWFRFKITILWDILLYLSSSIVNVSIFKAIKKISKHWRHKIKVKFDKISITITSDVNVSML